MRHDLTDAARRDNVLAELTARLTAGRLSAADVAAVADRALAAQAGPPGSWSPRWGTFVESAHAAGRLDRGRWATYGRQAVRLGLRLDAPHAFFYARRFVSPGTVYRGEGFTADVSVLARPLVNARFRTVLDVDDIRIDGQPAACRPASARNADHFGGRQGWFEFDGRTDWGGGGSPEQVESSATRCLAVGRHTITATAHVLLYDRADLPNLDGQPHPLPDASKLLAAFDVQAASAMQVGVQPVLKVDPPGRAAMAAAFRDVTVTVDGPDVHVHGRIENLPRRVVFGVKVCGLDGFFGRSHVQSNLGAVVARSAGYSGPFEASGTAGFLAGATRVDVTLTPDLAAAVDNVDPTPVWGEPIVFHNLRVPPLRPALATDPRIGAAVRQSIRDLAVVEDSACRVTVTGRVVAPPACLACRVSVRFHGRSGDVAVPIGSVECDAGQTAPLDLRVRVADDTITRTDVVFDPDLDAELVPDRGRPAGAAAAQHTPDGDPPDEGGRAAGAGAYVRTDRFGSIWGERVEFDDLPIRFQP